MHTTDTVDMEFVISGEIVLELDDGVETTLRAGDVNIQNGTRHRGTTAAPNPRSWPSPWSGCREPPDSRK
jgi:quercetin dioxygenase-like cupin family protein